MNTEKILTDFFTKPVTEKITKILFWKQNGVEQSGIFQLTRFISLLRRILGWIHLTTQIPLHFGPVYEPQSIVS